MMYMQGACSCTVCNSAGAMLAEASDTFPNTCSRDGAIGDAHGALLSSNVDQHTCVRTSSAMLHARALDMQKPMGVCTLSIRNQTDHTAQLESCAVQTCVFQHCWSVHSVLQLQNNSVVLTSALQQSPGQPAAASGVWPRTACTPASQPLN